MTRDSGSVLLRWGASIAVLVLAAVPVAWYLKHRAGNTPQYQTGLVTRGDLTQAVTATGQLNPVVNVQVGSQISGMIEKLFVDFNSPVQAGQVIAQIDPATYQANTLQAEADLANAKAALELAQVKAARAGELREKQLIPQSDHDQAMADLHQAEANVKTKQAALQKAKVDLERCTIHAPIDGIVISRDVDVGQTVAASLQAPTLFVIANDLTKMQINANVAEADIGNVEVGQDVEFTVDAFPTRTFHGKVVQVRNAPVTVQNVVTYDTIVEVSNPDLKLKPGMTANISIIIAHQDNVLKIPNAALRFRPPEPTQAGPGESQTRPGSTGRAMAGGKREHAPTRTVYVLNTGGKLQPAQISIGITDGISTEVTEGLNENDKVVTGAVVTQATGNQPPSPFGGGIRRF
jgi:HlyD family secretion protein